MSTTGIQGFSNYDTFSLLGPMAGRSQAEAIGFINIHNLNLCFTQTDMVLKNYNNPPILTRSYNSKNQSEDVFFKNGGYDGVSFIGRDWMLNYEHCLVKHVIGENEEVFEIDPTGARNVYTENAGNYDSPAGIFKTLSWNSTDSTFEITTRDYFTYSFSVKNRDTNLVTGNGDTYTFYGLDWIKDRYGVMVVVNWDTGDDFIESIGICPSQVKYDDNEILEVITFNYLKIGTGEEAFYLINDYTVNKPGNDPQESVYHWWFTYDTEDDESDKYLNLTDVVYPQGGLATNDISKCSYQFEYTSGGILQYIHDMMDVVWEFVWWLEEDPDFPGTVHPSNNDDYNVLTRRIYPKGVDHTVSSNKFNEINYYDCTTSNDTFVVNMHADFDEDYWQYTHDANGKITERKDPVIYADQVDGFRYSWNGTKWVLEEFKFPSDDYVTFNYNGTTWNLEEIKYYDASSPAYNDAYTVKYAYLTGDDKYLVKDITFDYANGDPPEDWWSKTKFDYDNRALVKITMGIGGDDPTDRSVVTPVVTQFTYTENNLGNVSSIINPEGGTVHFKYHENFSPIWNPENIEDIGFGALTSVLASIPGDSDPYDKPPQYPYILTYDSLERQVLTFGGYGHYTTTTKYSSRDEVTYACSSTHWSTAMNMTYDKMSNPVKIAKGGRFTIYDFDLTTYPLNMPVEIATSELGEGSPIVKFVYDERGLRETRYFLHDGAWPNYAYTYSASLQLIKITPPIVTEDVEYDYDYNGNLTKVTDPGDNETTYAYNFAGQLTSTTWQSSGIETNTEEYTYDQPMGMVSQIDRKWRDGTLQTSTWKYEYDRLGRCYYWEKPEVTGGSNHRYTMEYYYDANSNLIAIRHGNYNVSTQETTYRHEYYEYDSYNRITRFRREFDGEKTVDVSYTYNKEGQLTDVSAAGIVTSLKKYNEGGQLVAEYKPGQDPETEGTRYSYLSDGSLGAIIGSGDAVTSISYDCGGRIASITDPDGRTFRKEYWEGTGWLKRDIMPSGDFIGYEYDSMGRVTRVWETVPDIITSQVANPWGLDEKEIALTLEVTYSWSTYYGSVAAKGRNIVYKTAYSTDPYYFLTIYQYDYLGRLFEVSVPPIGTQDGAAPVWMYRYSYDYRGNLKTAEYNDNSTPRQMIANTYDDLKRRLTQNYAGKITDGSATVSNITNSYEYCCCALQKATQTNAGNPVRDLDFTRDSIHRLTKEKYTDTIPGNNPFEKEYDYLWDNASRLIKFTDPAFGDTARAHPKQTVYHHDEETNSIKMERIDRGNPDKTNAETYRYELDSIGRIKRLIMPDATGDFTEATDGYYSFNADFIQIDYTYLKDGRISSIYVQNLIDDSSLYFISYRYDANGRMAGYTVKAEPGASRSFKYRSRIYYDGRGQTVREVYDTYDSTDKVVVPVASINCAYDLAGNLKTKDVINDTYTWIYTFTYDTGYRIRTLVVGCTDGTDSWIFTYTPTLDYRGNLSEMSVIVAGVGDPPELPIDLPETLAYDSYNRLVEYGYGANEDQRTKTLWYDPMGRVFRKETYNEDTEETTAVTHYYYKGDKVVQEFDLLDPEVTDDIKWDYLRSPSGKVVRRREVTDLDQDQWTDHLHFNDAQRTVKNEEEVSAAIAQPDIGYAVSVAGEPLPVSSVTSTDENHIQWQGAFLEDKELNTAADSDRGYLSRMGVRHYSPAFGRFLQRDPVNNYGAPNPMFPLAHNPYQYAYNQPTQYSDTSGYQCCGLGGGGAGTLGGSHNLYDESDSSQEGQEVDPGNCIIPWPDNSGCFPKTCYMCCVGKNGIDFNPWCDAVCLIPMYGDMTSCECQFWCENAKHGGENHPSPMEDVPSGGNRRPIYGPPSYGPGGDGGDRPWILPLYPIPGNGFPERWPWTLMQSNNFFERFEKTDGINVPSLSIWIGPTTMTIGSIGIRNTPWYMPPPEWRLPAGLGLASMLASAGIGAYCSIIKMLHSPYNPGDPCSMQGTYWQCIRGACCNWSKCNEISNLVSVLTGVLIGIITLNGWAGFGSFGIVKSVSTLACASALISMAVACKILSRGH